MKITKSQLRRIIKEEITKISPKKDVALTAKQLRHIIVTEAAKLAGAPLLNEATNFEILQGIIDDKIILKRIKRKPPAESAESDNSADATDAAVTDAAATDAATTDDETGDTVTPVTEAKSFSRKTLVKKKNKQILTEAFETRADRVKAVQQALIKLGYNVGRTKDDGDYGPATEKGVVKFQQAQGWGQPDIDARVGPKTAAALINALKKADTDAAPRIVRTNQDPVVKSRPISGFINTRDVTQTVEKLKQQLEKRGIKVEDVTKHGGSVMLSFKVDVSKYTDQSSARRAVSREETKLRSYIKYYYSLLRPAMSVNPEDIESDREDKVDGKIAISFIGPDVS
jgi:peptidoglycan hydrolase-like protein with peptidoglycan-binding domain